MNIRRGQLFSIWHFGSRTPKRVDGGRSPAMTASLTASVLPKRALLLRGYAPRIASTGILGLFTLGLAGNALGATTECPARFDGKRLTHVTISDGPSRELEQQTTGTAVLPLPYPPIHGRAFYLVCNYGTTALSLPLPNDTNACWDTKDYRTVCGRDPHLAGGPNR